MYIEEWKDIPGYEGRYQASNLGRVRSLDRLVKHKDGHIQKAPGKTLKPSVSKTGYHQVVLSKDGIEKPFYVHRLVWASFNGEIPKELEINHIDEDKSNNSLSNLNLLSHQANNIWGTKLQRQIEKQSVAIMQYDLDGNLIKEWKSATEAGRVLGVYPSNITTCCVGKNSEGKNIKTAYGFKWGYKETEVSVRN